MKNVKLVTAKELEWGVKWVNVAAPAIWGARAIVENDELHILHDRQGWIGDPTEGPWLHGQVNEQWPRAMKLARQAHGGRSPEWHVLGKGKERVALCASSGANGGKTGYIYILACRPQLAVEANLELLETLGMGGRR